MKIKQFYSYEDIYGENYNKDFHENLILKELKLFRKEEWIEVIGRIGLNYSLRNELNSIKRLQKELLDFKLNGIIIHRRCILVFIQFLYSIREEEFSENNKISKKNFLDILLSINSIINLTEDNRGAFQLMRKKKSFFFWFRIVHASFTINDLQGNLLFFEKFYKKLIEIKKYDEYNSLIKEKIGINIKDFIEELRSLIEGEPKIKLLEIVKKIGSIDSDKMHQLWDNRQPKFEIPLEYNFIKKYPVLNIGDKSFIFDKYTLIELLFQNIYSSISSYDNQNFKREFGKKVAEPVITSFLKETFCDGENIKSIKIDTKKYEFGDFALLNEKDIYLFEIKTTFLNIKSKYTVNYSWFFNELEDKLIKKEGVNQQIKKLIRIDEDFEDFCKLSSIDKKIKYTIYPILLLFDESFQAFRCNWYFNYRFSQILKDHKAKFNMIKLSNCNMIITLNELFILSQRFSNKDKRLGKLKNYGKRKIPSNFCFRESIK